MGWINILIEGYPILHSIAIELRDEENETLHPRYLKLTETILQAPHCNPNILDKHGKPQLMYAAEEDNTMVLNLLLQHGATCYVPVYLEGKKLHLKHGTLRNPTAKL